jgi:hypothetical protein
MRYIYSIIKADYLQRTRSYAFLITLVITVYAAYSFVPPPTASYTTLNMPGYKAVFNSAWVGYISAMMTTVMLSLYGYFLVNSGIKKDIETEVGLIIATTPITNFGYLLSKMFSNYLVLLTIAGCTFVVSIGMFFLRTTDSPFILSNFVWPYLFFAAPALFLTSALAIVGEVFLGRRPMLQYLMFFFFFGVLMNTIKKQSNDAMGMAMDPYGLNTMTHSIKEKVNMQYHTHMEDVSFGFIFNSKKKPYQTFTWEGLHWTGVFLLSRLGWIGFSLGLVYLSSFFFHRFDFKSAAVKKKKKGIEGQPAKLSYLAPQGISKDLMPPVVADYGIFPLIKTELLLLIRQGNARFWLVIGGVWISLLFAPLAVGHSILLPVLWFLQVTRWSDLATKEKTNRLHYFTFSSYKPLQRMLPAQVLAGIVLAIGLALPVISRELIAKEMYSVIHILNGAVLIVLLAVCLGIVSGGKKLFEILFFMLTYAIINKVYLTDYLGAIPHDSHTTYMVVILMISLVLGLVSFAVRNYQARHL